MNFQLRIIDWEMSTEKNRRDEGIEKGKGEKERKREETNKSKERDNKYILNRY